MIIEFIGTPGAGKTTLLPVVMDYFDGLGFRAYTVVQAARPFAARTLLGRAISRLAPAGLRQQLLWQVFYHLSKLYRLRFMLKNRELIYSVQRFQRKRPITSQDREHVLYWFLHLIGYYEFLKSQLEPNEALIFDEGFIHRVVQLFASKFEEPDPDQITAYINLIPKPDLVVFPSAPKEMCEKRVYARGIWDRFRLKSREEISRYMANSHEIVNLAVDYIQKKGWVVLSVDNGGEDPGKAKAELNKELSSSFTYSFQIPEFQPQAQ